MVLVLFIIVFRWSVAKGISGRQKDLKFYSISSKRVKNEIEMVTPANKINKNINTIHLDDFFEHKKKESRKLKVQIVSTSILPEIDKIPIYLN